MNSVQAVESSPEARDAAHPISKVVFYSPGPAPCRCGRYFSEDFEG